jgi:hydrogenase maturation protease
MTRPLLIGVGTPYAGDDAVGRWVAGELSGQDAFGVAQSTGIALDLLAFFEGREKVLIIDACRSGAPIGTLHRFVVPSDPIPASMNQASSHGMGVAEAVRLAETLDLLPKSLTLWAIEGESFSLGADMHPEVRRTAEKCVMDSPSVLAG